MAENDVSLRLRVDGAARVSSEIAGVDQAIDRLHGSVVSATRVGAGLAAAFGLVIPAISGTVRAAIQTADAVSTLNNQLKLATGGTTAAAQAYESLFAIAQRSRVGLLELGDTFASISRAGQDLGVGQERLLRVTEAIANAMTISGGAAASARAALVQLGQGLAAGTLRGEELNSVMEQAPRLAQALAEGLNVPIGKLREMGAAGEISARQVIEALEKAGPQLAKEVEGSALTVGQAFTVLTNAAIKFTGEADSAAGATSALAGAIVSVADAVTAVGRSTAVLDGLRTVGEALRVLWSDVAFVFSRTGAEIGGIAAQIAAVLRGEFRQAATIRAEMIADSTRAREELDRYQQAVLNRTGQAIDAEAEAQGRAMREQARLAREQAAAERDLSALRQRLGGVSAAYVKEMQEVIRLNKAGVLVGSEYVETLGQMQDKLIKTPASARAHASALRETERTARDAQKAYERYVEAIYRRAMDEAIAEQRAMAEAVEATQRAMEDGLDTLRNSAATVEQQVQGLRDEAAAAALAAERNIDLAEAIQLVAIARLQERQEQYTREGDQGSAVDAIEREIEARRALIDEMRRRKLRESAEESSNAWIDAARDIERALTDAMVRGFSGGRSLAKSVGDWIANYFRTTVARTIAQALTGAFSLSLPGLASAGGSAVGSAATGGGGGSLGILGQLLGGASAFGGTLGAGVFGTLGTFGLTAGAGTLGTLSAAGSLIGTGTSAGIGAGLGLGAGALLPYVGIALGVYSLAQRIKDNGGSPALQNFSYLDASGQAAAAPWRTPNLQSSSAYNEALMPIIGSVNDLVRALGGAVDQSLRYGLFSSVSPDGKGGQTVAELAGAGGPLYVSNVNAGNDTVQQRLEAELPRLLLAGLQASDLPQQFADFFAKIDVASATKEQVEQAIATAQTAGEVAKLIGDVGSASVEALASIADLSGGISQLASNLGTYYQEFYSQAEREAMLRKQLAEALGQVNVALPDSRAAFRQLVESQDLTTEAGRQTYSALLAVAGAFAELNPEIVSVGESLRSAADIAAERADLERRLLEVQGNTVALRQLELDKLDPSNRALLEHIYALEDEAKAAQEAADQAARVAGERQNLETRLLQLQGDTAALRERELASVDESNRELLRRIYALDDEAAAARATADELARMNAEIERVATERYSLETRLLQAQGETAELREREIAALDPSNRALLEHIYALEDEAKAAQEAAAQAARIAGERQNLEARLLRALGDTAAIREAELAAVDESNREILKRIYALDDEAAAARATADELARMTTEMERVAAERYGLETRLLQVQGETAELREREIAALDDSNRALLRQINLIEDWKLKTQRAAQAAADVAREQISTLRPLVGFIESAIDDLIGGGGLGMSAAGGRQFVSLAAQTARSTGYLPEQEALQKAVRAAQGDFGLFATKAEEQRARIRLAKQLEVIGDVASGQLSDAEKALNVANEQLKQLQEINAGLRKLSEFGVGTTDQLKQLQEINAGLLKLSEFGVGTTVGAGDEPVGDTMLLPTGTYARTFRCADGSIYATGVDADGNPITTSGVYTLEEIASGIGMVGDQYTAIAGSGADSGIAADDLRPDTVGRRVAEGERAVSEAAMARARLLLEKNRQLVGFNWLRGMSAEEKESKERQLLARWSREYQDRIDAGIDPGEQLGAAGQQSEMQRLLERVELMAEDTRRIRRQLSRTRALTQKGEAIRVTTESELT